MSKLNSTSFKNQFTDEREISQYEDLVKNINANDFQAILPIPFFHVGTEKEDLTIDPNFKWLNSMGKISYLTNLPLMASQMSRTAPYQAEELFTIFNAEKPSDELLKRLNDKSILVVYSKYYNHEDNTSWFINISEKMREVAFNGKHIIEKHQMTLIKETSSYKLYQWDLEK